MNKIVIVINGKAGVGKDTLCDFVIERYHAKKISSITPILKIAMDNGWDGTKDNKSRKFLSDLKRTFIDFNNLPYNYLIEEYKLFLQSDDDILFVHIRESDQIQEFISSIKNSCVCATLLISNINDGEPIVFGNDSDDCVDNFPYDFTYHNTEPIEQAEQDFLAFFQELLDAKKITPREKPDTK